ncbi:MAG: hypothetical protein U0002_11570 [Thermoanaerobaculia bacterium]
MRVVLVEDDYPQGMATREEIFSLFPQAQILWIKSESAFRLALSDLAAEPPDLFILDVMVRWAGTERPIPEPPMEIKREGFFRAGLRCQRLLAAEPRLRSVPVLLLSVLEERDLSLSLRQLDPAIPTVRFLQKGRESVVEAIEKILHARSSRPN